MTRIWGWLKSFTPFPTLQRDGWGEGVARWVPSHPNPLPQGERGLGGLASWLFESSVRGPRSTSVINGFQHTLEVFPNLGVPKTKHQPALLGEKLVSSLILLAAKMLAAIQFHPHPPLVANIVGNSFFQIFLAAKLKARLAISQPTPKRLFFRRLVTPEFSGNFLKSHGLSLNPLIHKSKPIILMPLAPSPTRGEGGG